MPSDQWNKKKILLNAVQMDDFRWRPEPNPRMDDQELFLAAKDHDAIIINGDKYITNNITESKEFDWIRQQEPEKKLKKTKSYVVDVSHLRPAPMRHSHDPSLTRQDILRRFKDLGYNAEDIDVDEAKYFYIEPNQGSGWQYNEYGTPIEYDYWIDYNTHYMGFRCREADGAKQLWTSSFPSRLWAPVLSQKEVYAEQEEKRRKEMGYSQHRNF